VTVGSSPTGGLLGTARFRVPGVRLEEVAPPVPRTLLTGVPLFLGYAGEVGGPAELLVWQAFRDTFGVGPPDAHLAAAVHGFFAGGGRLCHVVGLDPALPPLEALQQGLGAAHDLDVADLVCAPDVGRATVLGADPIPTAAALQAAILAYCRRAGGRFALLDTIPNADRQTVLDQRAALRTAVIGQGLDGADGALYHPWVWVPGPSGALEHVPPCGHVAAVYARTDAAVGVHKAPANEVLDGVVDLRADLSDTDTGTLADAGVNCLLARPGRGIRVWGARTLADDPAWRHVGARRVLLTVGRWLERFLGGTVHEPHDLRLRVRVMREVSAYLEGLYSAGALRGATADEAFFVKCDAETTPPELADAGLLVTTVGLALTAPAEFLVLRVTRGASGVTTGPSPTSG
jgi:Bacteriophage tail sheath protein